MLWAGDFGELSRAVDYLPVDFLRGSIEIERGGIEDYRGLAHLHYVPGDPATVAGVWRATYRDVGASRVVAVAALSWPVPSSAARERALGLRRGRDVEKLRWLNANVRTISRVIVHPQFRSLGIASALVRRVLLDCPVRYVEAFAVMGKIVPFFERAGMKSDGEGGKYFWLDRGEGN